MFQHLLSEEGRRLSERLREDPSQKPWDSYPRPQMVRENWQNLNGYWDFGVNDESCPEKILVPFCPESLLSGICRRFSPDTVFYYRRHFTAEAERAADRILLHFGAADQYTEVFVNGSPAGVHEGGYLHFSFDITELVRLGSDNELLVRITDPLDHRLPWGKQKADRGGMWYTPVSGLWQTVWLETVPENYIRTLQIESHEDYVDITAEGVSYGTLTLDIGPSYEMENGHVRIRFGRPHCWSPEDPYLYYFTLEAGNDYVRSYFALRSIRVGEVGGIPRILLNGEPYFFNGLLDQGYYSDGIYTPASPDCFAQDIAAVKPLGFNTLRKHIKIEPEAYYYDCDRLGMIVFQDMVNNGDYAFFRDSALPTAGLTRIGDHFLHKDPAAREAFLSHMQDTVRQLSSHPSIVLWTIFNEGWGQFEADKAYELLHGLDPTRLIDSASGWFRVQHTDIDSRHIYFRKIKAHRSALPQIISEFGGYVWKLPDHSADPEKSYGYRSCPDRESFLRDIRELYEKQLLPLVPEGLCGAIYTQLSDVEGETNGLLSYDRAVQKLSPEDFADIGACLCSAIKECGMPGRTSRNTE